MACKPDKKQIDEMFKAFDKDGSGKIDQAELKSAVKVLLQQMPSGKEPSDTEVDEVAAGLMQVCDTSGDGKIDKKEWYAFFEVQ